MKKTAVCFLSLTAAFCMLAGSPSDCGKKDVEQTGKNVPDVSVVSRWGFDPQDSTAILQRAIDSGVRKLIIDNQGKPWVSGPLKLRSNLELVFADGTVLQAKKGAFKGKNECLLLVPDAENVVIRGEGTAVLQMNKADYQNSKKYSASEWRHAVSLTGARNVMIRNLTIRSSGGDGIYIAGSRKKGGLLFSEKILVDGVSALEHHRQGISIISARNLLIRNCRFCQTEGTAPMCGLDFEPNNKRESLIDCVVEDCEFSGNASYGISLALQQCTGDTPPLSITFRRVRCFGNGLGALAFYSSPERERTLIRGVVRFEECMLDGGVRLFQHRGRALRLAFLNTTIKNMPGKPCLEASSISNIPIHFRCENTIFSGTAEEPILLHTGVRPDLNGTARLGGKTFSMEEWSCNYRIREENFVMGKLDINILSAKDSQLPKRNQSDIRLRWTFRFLQYARRGERITIDLLGKQVGKRTFGGEIQVYSPMGKKILSFPLRKAEEQLVFSAPETGIYLLTGDTAGNEYQLFSPHPGQGYVAEQLGFCHSRGRLYFEVPPNVADIRIEVKGDRNESITARLRDSRNKVVQEVRTKEKPVQLRHSRTYPERRELWSVEIVKMVEDGSLSLGLPLNPVFSPYPEALLRHE